MYRKIVLSAAGALAASAALAADLPSRASAPAPGPRISAPALFTWTGFYVGLNAGGAFGSGSNGGVSPAGFPVGGNAAPGAAAIFRNFGGNTNAAFVGGAQLGYNWQTGAFVVGVEADLQFLARRNNTGVGAAAPVAGFAGIVPYAINGSRTNAENFYGSVRGRLGYAVDRALFYVTGGPAYGNNSGNSGAIAYFNAANATAVPTAVYSANNASNRFGFSVGAGVEYALAKDWSVKGEYIYADLGRRNGAFTSVALPTTSFIGGSNRHGLNIARMGMNYKF